MDKGSRELLRQSAKGTSRSELMPGKTFVLAHQPAHQIIVHMPPHCRYCRSIEATVILRPSLEDRIEHVRKIGQLLVALQLQMPSSDGLPHGLRATRLTAGEKFT